MNKLMLMVLLFVVLKGLAQEQILITDISVVDVNGLRPHEIKNVIIANGVIQSILPVTEKIDKKGFTVVKGKGKYLVPGYIDAHVHLPAEESEYQLDAFFLSNLLNGVTSLRIMRYEKRNEAYRDSIEQGNYLGPNLFLCQPPIVKFIGYDHFEKQFTEYKRRGYPFVKYLTGLSKNQLDSVCMLLQQHAIPIAGHMHGSGPGINVKNKFRSIEHIQGLIMGLKADSTGMYALAKRMSENKVFVCPTYFWYYYGWDQLSKEELYAFPELKFVPSPVLSVWKGNYEDYEQTFMKAKAEQYEKEKKQYERDILVFDRYLLHLKKSNVKILVGSDDQSFGVPGFSYHREIAYLKKAGLSNADVLKAATKNGAECLEADQQMGEVKEKMKADLVILDADPLVSVENLKSISGMIKSGHYYTVAELNKRLEAALKVRWN